MSFDALWAELAGVGRNPGTGGYRRYAWTHTDLECREWFAASAEQRGLDVEIDRNGNMWAWWGNPAAGNAVAVGSHLDSVPDGGAYDGPLGIVSAFAAVDALHHEGHTPARPVGIAAFADEEGARFGVACCGSRLATGALDPDRARGLTDGDATTMADAMAMAGHDPARLGPDSERLSRLGYFIELHVEQGRVRVATTDGPAYGLVGLGRPVGVAEAIWPHGRWRFDFHGTADHAGTTQLPDRDDPMLGYATAVLAAREEAARYDALATFGKVRVEPNGVNAIASHVTAWLDARGSDERRVRGLVTDLAHRLGASTGPSAPDDLSTSPKVRISEESWTSLTSFEPKLRDRLASLLDSAPILPTGAGHDAGILGAAGVPSAMIFVRNPTGVSHSPDEYADPDDCRAGVEALTEVIRALTT